MEIFKQNFTHYTQHMFISLSCRIMKFFLDYHKLKQSCALLCAMTIQWICLFHVVSVTWTTDEWTSNLSDLNPEPLDHHAWGAVLQAFTNFTQSSKPFHS